MKAALDASALLAFLLDEPGKETVLEAVLAGAAMTSVNFAEVATRYALRGAAETTVRDLRARLPLPLVPVDDDLALEAALMAPRTRPAGLSPGDRICLALARREAVPALTADWSWARVADAVGVEVRLIR